MTTRLPLVLGTDGLPQQLQSGDTLASTSATSSVRQLTNGESSAAIVLGAPVYISAAATVKRAQANAKTTAKVIGLAYDVTTAAAGIGGVCVGGVLTGTTGQWDAVTGQTGGLTPGSTYFLDPTTVGKLTATAPTTVGQVNTAVGTAISTTDMEVEPMQPILL